MKIALELLVEANDDTDHKGENGDQRDACNRTATEVFITVIRRSRNKDDLSGVHRRRRRVGQAGRVVDFREEFQVLTFRGLTTSSTS